MQIIWKDKIDDSRVKVCVLGLEEYMQVSLPSLPWTLSAACTFEWHDWNEILSKSQNPISSYLWVLSLF